jgi:hypothetical protein
MMQIQNPMHAGIKAIKLYAWEVPYEKRIQQARKVERRAIFNMQVRTFPVAMLSTTYSNFQVLVRRFLLAQGLNLSETSFHHSTE